MTAMGEEGGGGAEISAPLASSSHGGRRRRRRGRKGDREDLSAPSFLLVAVAGGDGG